MACVICDSKTGMLEGNLAFKCKNCKKEICKDCAHKYGNARTWGGIFGDKHAEITCPNCYTVIKIR